MEPMKKLCTVYRSRRHEGMYLYVDKTEDLSRVPEALLQRFGEPKVAMTLVLHPGRVLARADVVKVLESLEQQGFFLQMPPRPEASMQALRDKNAKLQ